MEFKHGTLTDAILSAFFFVYKQLGYGFLEKVYRNALAQELRKRGFQVKVEVPIKVYYDGVIVGEYFADLLVNDLVILELKVAEAISREHEAQLINYLKATHVEVGLILNFGAQPKARRKVFDNELKRFRSDDFVA